MSPEKRLFGRIDTDLCPGGKGDKIERIRKGVVYVPSGERMKSVASTSRLGVLPPEEPMKSVASTLSSGALPPETREQREQLRRWRREHKKGKGSKRHQR